MTSIEALPFHIVSGFLGAGKTTLVNRLLRDPALAGSLVIVNEFGDIGLDHWLYEKLDGPAALLSSGCLCCELRGDLAELLRGLIARRDSGAVSPFSRIILETSGLADPGPVLYALIADPVLASRVGLAGVVTLVDAVNGKATLESHPEARRQLALADLVSITKRDLARDIADLEEQIRELNAAAPIVENLSADSFLQASVIAPIAERASRWAAHGGARAHAFSQSEPISGAALFRFFQALRRLAGPKLLRVKGLVSTIDDPSRPLVVEGAQHLVHAPRRLAQWPFDPHETRLVIIADGMSSDDIASVWRALTGLPEVDRPDLAALLDNPLAPRSGGLFD